MNNPLMKMLEVRGYRSWHYVKFQLIENNIYINNKKYNKLFLFYIFMKLNLILLRNLFVRENDEKRRKS